MTRHTLTGPPIPQRGEERLFDSQQSDAAYAWALAGGIAIHGELSGGRQDDGGIIAWGHSLWDGRQVTVNEAAELIAPHRPVRDTQTLLMPFIDEPPAERLRPVADELAAGMAGGREEVEQ